MNKRQRRAQSKKVQKHITEQKNKPKVANKNVVIGVPTAEARGHGD